MDSICFQIAIFLTLLGVAAGIVWKDYPQKLNDASFIGEKHTSSKRQKNWEGQRKILWPWTFHFPFLLRCAFKFSEETRPCKEKNREYVALPGFRGVGDGSGSTKKNPKTLSSARGDVSEILRSNTKLKEFPANLARDWPIFFLWVLWAICIVVS